MAQSPAEVARASTIVVTMLPSGKYVQEVALGDDGLIHGFSRGRAAAGHLVVRALADPRDREGAGRRSGVAMVDAPVSGAQIGAQTGELVFMAGGEPAALERVMPLLDVMGKQVFHLGGIGAGHTMKCLNNMITAMTFMATAEGLAIGKKLGLDPEVMTDVLNVSTGMSWISQTHIRQRITSRTFDDAFKLELMVKDIGIAMRLAGDESDPGAALRHGSAAVAGRGPARGEGQQHQRDGPLGGAHDGRHHHGRFEARGSSDE